jgi:alcohol dehydrogenase
MVDAFTVGRLPRVEFGAGVLRSLPAIAARFGRRLLLVTGARSFATSGAHAALDEGLRQAGIDVETHVVAGEPSPEGIDAAVARWHPAGIDVVVGIGGGSVLDAAKAIAGLLRPANTVLDHLEGVGPELPYRGPTTPFIAVPTTAGTGSEATRNAVLTRHGADGFKKSFRDEALVAQVALVDPDLLATCPPALIAANGMDAFTQLLEALTSTRASPFTDALALAGIEAVRDGIIDWYEGTGDAGQARSRMAFAALASGICLAQAGLGAVHGLAQPLGSLFPIAHGVVCGTLVGAATQVNIEAMAARDSGHAALSKYAVAGRLVGRMPELAADEARARLVAVIDDWTRRMRLPLLSTLGVTAADVDRIVARCRGSSMKTNPIVLSDTEVERIVVERL